jgi:Arc/MetJ-type ribon-helix-helix transcriptional regulator
VSATPEQIADWLIIVAVGDAANEYTNRAEHMRAAASLIRAQAERVRVLESALSAIVRISQETDELTELSAKEIIEALVNCEQTARAALKAAP